MSVPVDPSVLDLIRQTPAGPLLDRPVNEVLRELGIPPLPEIPGLPPLPELPPLPVLDLAALAKPLTDLAGGFGTGVLPSATQAGAVTSPPAPGQEAAPVDPAQVMQVVSGVLQTATTLGSTALQTVMSLWQSMAAMEAAQKAAEAAKDTTAVAEQSAQTSVGVTSAAGSVFRGAAEMSAVIAKFVASVTASAPFLATGAGQVFLVTLTTETIAEALAVVAKTRGELTVHSAAMTETGTKIPVTNAPDNVDPMQAISQVMAVLGPLSQLATSLPQQVASIHQALQPAKTLSTTGDETKEPDGGHPGAGVGGVGGGAVGGVLRGLGG
ncbi:hypothetical protein, partial [Nocardia farcinica]|uniref:hypothetical protein n=1 Tax=Nocardia farcinica TaxID=37329 RepID=UPI002455F347